MIQRKHLPLLLLGALVPAPLGLGCSDGATSATADTATAADAADTVSMVDTATVNDDAAAVPDVNSVDATADDDAADGGDSDSGDASGCTFFDEPRLVLCHGLWTRVAVWSDWGNPSCGSTWTFGPDRYATLEALAAAVGCDDTCVLAATIAVDFVDCDGHRNGYEVYEAADACGGPAYGTSGGIFTDLCLWPSQACYCEER